MSRGLPPFLLAGAASAIITFVFTGLACSQLTASATRLYRGGDFNHAALDLRSAASNSTYPEHQRGLPRGSLRPEQLVRA